MPITHHLYSRFAEGLLKGEIPNLASSGTTVKCALMFEDTGNNPFTFNHNHQHWGDVTSFECRDDDYVNEGGTEEGIRGQIIPTKTVTRSGTVTTFDTGAVPKKLTYTAHGNIKATHAVIFIEVLDGGTLTPADSRLISCVDFGAVRESVEGEFSITFSASGIASITVA